jgi:hypothetical protein
LSESKEVAVRNEEFDVPDEGLTEAMDNLALWGGMDQLEIVVFESEILELYEQNVHATHVTTVVLGQPREDDLLHRIVEFTIYR